MEVEIHVLVQILPVEIEVRAAADVIRIVQWIGNAGDVRNEPGRTEVSS